MITHAAGWGKGRKLKFDCNANIYIQKVKNQLHIAKKNEKRSFPEGFSLFQTFAVWFIFLNFYNLEEPLIIRSPSRILISGGY